MSDLIDNPYRDGDAPKGAVGKNPYDTGAAIPDTDITTVGHAYSAVVTAHFKSHAAAEAVYNMVIEERNGDEEGLQIFEQPEEPNRADQTDHELEPGQAALIIQVADEEEGTRLVALCEAHDALHARFYPEQRIGAARGEEE